MNRVIVLLSLLCSACVMESSVEPRDQPSETTAVACSEPRPQMCTMDYRPVCGVLKQGDKKTYSNGCAACSDKEVVSWLENECVD